MFVFTFFDSAQVGGLAIGKHSFHVYAHVTTGTVGTTDDTETESLVSGSFEKSCS